MRHQRLLIVLPAILSALLMSGIVLAQVSPNFELRWWLLNNGGGARQSAAGQLQDTLGQWAAGSAASNNARIEAGFWPGVVDGGPLPTLTETPTLTPTGLPTPTPTQSLTPIPTPSSTPTGLPTPTPTATPTPTRTGTPTPTGLPGDAYESDNTCAQARSITPDGLTQIHTFHVAGDQDWIKFTASANRTFIFQVANTAVRADPVVLLYDNCNQPPQFGQDNAFGRTLRLEWDGRAGTTYYLKLQQRDPSIAGSDTTYDLSVTVDVAQPAAPKNLRCAALDSTTLSLQWQESPEDDVVAYEVHYQEQGGSHALADSVEGKTSTYHLQGQLHTDKWYDLWVIAKDYSNNRSDASAIIACKPHQPRDTTAPRLNLQQPTAGNVYTTTMGNITLAGLATDDTNNLSRVRAYNITRNVEGWDYSLQGSSHAFRVENLALGNLDNLIELTVYDDAGNSTKTSLMVKRQAQSLGAVIIVAGHNEDFALQSNIDNSANRAYRTFRSAGISEGNIYFLAASPQDPDSDGASEVSAAVTYGNLKSAIEVWAAAHVDTSNPLYLYMMDHGGLETFCTDGCDTNPLDPKGTTPVNLHQMLTALETGRPGLQINVIIEACHSGSFIDALEINDSISKNGRVIITSTDRVHNAYASAQGAYFSDVFFSCIAAGSDLRSCFSQARAAVVIMPHDQSPWLDDNGDGRFDATDGTIAGQRFVARFFGAVLPQITSAAVSLAGANGTLTAQVQSGSAKIDTVWAAVYRPSFQEPTQTTLDLGVPLVRLDPDPSMTGRYTAFYPNGFTETGQYRVIFYARDKVDGYATPRLVIPNEPAAGRLFLPLLLK